MADRSERRNLTRAQQAMRLALLYPEPDKRDLGKTIKRERQGAGARARRRRRMTWTTNDGPTIWLAVHLQPGP